MGHSVVGHRLLLQVRVRIRTCQKINGGHLFSEAFLHHPAGYDPVGSAWFGTEMRSIRYHS